MSRSSFRFFLTLFLVFVSTKAFAEYFYIKNYSSEIYIHKNSIIDIREKIKVHFNFPRHGIYRLIPYEYEYANTNSLQKKKVLVRLHIFNIETPGFKHKIYYKNGNVVIKIGNPNVYLRNDVNYIISYSIYGALRFFKDGSRLLLNVIGTKWKIPINSSSFEIVLPKLKNYSKIRYVLYSGYLGSKNKENSTTFEEGILSCTIDHKLLPHQGVTVSMTFPKGYLTKSGFILQMKLFIYENRAFFLPLFVFIALLAVWLIIGKDEKSTIMTYYKPPEGVTPAEAGLLIDDKIDNRDLISLIYYWASKGYLGIEETESKTSLFKKKDFILKKLKDLPEDAKEFELIIFKGLFPGRIRAVRISTLKDKFYKTISYAKESLNRYIKDKEVYEKGTRGLSGFLMMSSIFILGYAFTKTAQDTKSFTALLLTAVIVFIFGKIMPKKTQEGLEEYAAIKGFKEFMDKVEEKRLKKLLNEDPEYFYNTLAYAISFGEHKKWASKFSDLVSEPPRWYVGQTNYINGNFSIFTFVDLVNNSIVSIAEALGSLPSASEGGGGGVSGTGTGAGGGGGSSW